MNDLVSIIIPVFNRFNVLQRTINSVLAQTYKNWEIFIIDDCSYDILDYAILKLGTEFHNKITIIRNENNVGPGLSRQIGVDNSLGKLICFLDSDDYWADMFLEKSVSLHSLNPDISATYCITNENWNDRNCLRKNSDKKFDEIFPTFLVHSRPWGTCSLMWKKKYIDKWKNVRTGQDTLFEFDSAKLNNNILHIPELLAFVDKSTGQNSADLVSYEKSLLNRHNNFIHFHGHYNLIQSQNYSREQIRSIIKQQIIKNAIRLSHFRDNENEIFESSNIVLNSLIISKFLKYLYVLDYMHSKIILKKLLLGLLILEKLYFKVGK